MINKHLKLFNLYMLLTLCLLLTTAFTVIRNSFFLEKDYAFSIHGTSNIHDWVEKVVAVSGNGIVKWNSDGSFDIEAIQIKIDVRSIQSDMGSTMNNNTYKALKADAHPKIIFTLVKPIVNIKTLSNEVAINATGNLSVAGVTKTIVMQVKVLMKAHDKLAFEGAQSIYMTAFGIKPPTALFGTLQTGNTVKIKFKTHFTVSTK